MPLYITKERANIMSSVWRQLLRQDLHTKRQTYLAHYPGSHTHGLSSEDLVDGIMIAQFGASDLEAWKARRIYHQS